MPYVINNRRTACRVSASLGHGLGGVLAVIEMGPARDRADTLRRWLIDSSLPAALAKTGVVGAHLGEADAAATTVKTDEKKLLQAPDAMARWLVMLEGVDENAVVEAAGDVLGDDPLRAAGVDGGIERGVYRLSFLMARSA